MDQPNRLAPHTCKIEDASCISITVVLKIFNKHKASLAYKNTLQEQCCRILVNSMVTPSSTVAFTHSKLASAYGITNIIVSQCKVKGFSNMSDIVRVDHKTEIQIECVQSADYFHLKLKEEPILLGGLEGELQQLKALLEFNRIPGLPSTQRTMGVLLHGPPGCGKTSLGKALAQSSGAAILSVQASDVLKSEFGAGAKALESIFTRAISLSGEGTVILFLEELDILCPHPVAASLGNKQLTSALTSEMDKLHSSCIPGLLVVATTNAVSNMSPVLRRPGRFDREVLLTIPSRQQRLAILQVQTSDMDLAGDVSLVDLASMTPGYVGADLQALCQESLNYAHKRLAQAQKIDDLLDIQMLDFTSALHKVSPSLKKGLNCHVDLQPVMWNDIGGLNDVKAEIRQSIEWPLLHPEALRRMDLSATKGVLLYGPPGCCKTTLVKAAATSCHVTFLSLSGAHVYSPYVGKSERIISETFQKARALSPCILFLDEIDSLVGKRSSGGGQSRVQERVLATLLNEMDGIGQRLDLKTDSSYTQRQQSLVAEKPRSEPTNGNVTSQATCVEDLGQDRSGSDSRLSDVEMSRVIVIGATNRPDLLDPAILRPGRLDRHIYVPPPDAEGRKSIINIQVSKMAVTDLDLDYLSSCTECFSGADLKNLCREAGLTAVRESSAQGQLDASSLAITQDHFTSALSVVKPSISRQLLQQYTTARRTS